MGDELNKKVKGIVGLYNFYKHQMTTPQRIALLTMWIEACEKKEEYEVAAALQKEMDRIINGEEDYILIPPTTPLGTPNFMTPTTDEIKQRIVMSMEEGKPKTKKKKLKLKWVNYWGSGKFILVRLSFGDFKFILFNIGIEMK